MSVRPFQFQSAGAVSFGPGLATQLAEQRPLKKTSRVAVVTDAGVEAAGLSGRVLEGLGDKVAFVDNKAVPDADADHVRALAARLKAENVEAVVAVGGGSVLDTAKTAAAVAATDRSLDDLEGFAKVRARLLPLVAVPTTAGTGAESTQFSVVKDHGRKHKHILTDMSLVPALAVLDPELLTSLPAHITAATGVDALAHAIEALASKAANPVADALALEAVRRIIEDRALSRSISQPSDVAARGEMLVAANLAGQAISSAMLGACHAFAHALGAGWSVPHGVANGLFLGPVMRLNLEKAEAKYAMLGRVLGGTGTSRALAEHAIDRVEDLIHVVAGLPTQLTEVGVLPKDLDALADGVMADPDLITNPVRITDKSHVLAMLEARI